MLTSPFFRRLFLPYLVLICLAVGIVGVLGASRLSSSYIERTRQGLRHESGLVAELVEADLVAGRLDQVQQHVRRLGQMLECRVTVIDADGRVLADSEADPAHMDNHRLRPEVITAISQGEGDSRRTSDTLHQGLMYYARRVPSPNGGFHLIRLAVHLGTLEQALGALTTNLVVTAVLAMLGAAALGFYFARRHTLPLVELTHFARALAQGHMDRRILRPPRGEMGTLARALNSMADSLSHLLAQTAEGKAELQAIVSSMAEGVLATDTHQRIVLSNASVAALLGFPEGQAEGKMLWEVVRSQALLQAAEEVLHGGGIRRFQIGPSAGRFLDVAVCIFPSSGEPKGLVLVAHDSTQTVRYQELRKEFVANVSHELRTPLTLIKGFAETLREGAIHDPVKGPQYLATIEKRVDQLANLVSDLLELSRLESQADLPRRLPLDVGSIARRATDLLVPAARKKGQRLEVDICTELPQVVGNADYLERAIVNLVDNAIKYTPEQGRITVKVQPQPAHVLVEVADNGVGIPAEDLPRIFERFYRVDRSRSRDMGGTGLGLSIVKHVAQAHGGTVEVSSSLGAGSCFRLKLPLPAVSGAGGQAA